MPRKKKEIPVMESTGTKVLLVTLNGDKEMKVEIPSNSKVTFGPAIPGPSRRMDGYGSAEYAVRVYDGATEKAGLLAVFTGVREFRIDTIKVSKLVIRETGKTLWSSDEDGLEVQHSVKRDRKMLPERF